MKRIFHPPQMITDLVAHIGQQIEQSFLTILSQRMGYALIIWDDDGLVRYASNDPNKRIVMGIMKQFVGQWESGDAKAGEEIRQ